MGKTDGTGGSVGKASGGVGKASGAGVGADSGGAMGGATTRAEAGGAGGAVVRGRVGGARIMVGVWEDFAAQPRCRDGSGSGAAGTKAMLLLGRGRRVGMGEMG